MTMQVKHFNDVKPLELRDIQVTLDTVLGEVLKQDTLARQGRFGGTHILPSGPDHARLGVLTEELGEVARELNEALMHPGRARSLLINELIQVAASAVAWATAADHEGPGG